MDSTIQLTIREKWFNMIISGEKKEEYREIKPFWIKRLFDEEYENTDSYYQLIEDLNKFAVGESGFKSIEALYFSHGIWPKNYLQVFARNGYNLSSPSVLWQHVGLDVNTPNPDWCSPADREKVFFVLKIGDIIKTENERPEKTQLEIGDNLYGFKFGSLHEIVKIDRVTSKRAFSGHYEFERELKENKYVKVRGVSSQFGITSWKLEDESLKKIEKDRLLIKELDKTDWRHVNPEVRMKVAKILSKSSGIGDRFKLVLD